MCGFFIVVDQGPMLFPADLLMTCFVVKHVDLALAILQSDVVSMEIPANVIDERIVTIV